MSPVGAEKVEKNPISNNIGFGALKCVSLPYLTGSAAAMPRATARTTRAAFILSLKIDPGGESREGTDLGTYSGAFLYPVRPACNLGQFLVEGMGTRYVIGAQGGGKLFYYHLSDHTDLRHYVPSRDLGACMGGIHDRRMLLRTRVCMYTISNLTYITGALLCLSSPTELKSWLSSK